MDRKVSAGQFYRHFKGKLYQIVAVAEHSETGEPMVVYQALYGNYRIYVRPYDMFISEVDHKKYPEVTQKYRFEQIEFVLQKEGQTSTDNAPEKPAGEGTAQNTANEGMSDRQSKDNKVPYEESPERDLVNPDLMRFLEAENYEDKMLVLESMKKRLTPQIIQTIAMSMDFSLEEGSLDEQYEAIMYYLETRARYEGRRLR